MAEITEQVTYQAPETKEVTVQQIYEALKQNGFQHLRRSWTHEDITGAIDGACVLGQAAVNLGVAYAGTGMWTPTDFAVSSLEEQLNRFPVPEDSIWLSNERFNEAPGIGSLIIALNDATDVDNDYRWLLPTYEDVVNMAHDLMKPYFDKTLNLLVKEWKMNK